MAVFHLTGRITDSGKLEVELPPNLPPGGVEITIQSSFAPDDESPVTPEELEQYLHPARTLTGKEIVESGLLGGWEDMGITDSQAWVEEQRRNIR
jgi:hypothetical protein